MKSTRTKQIRLTVDKNGNQLAHEWSPKAMRYIKISMDQARLELATGQAKLIHAGNC